MNRIAPSKLFLAAAGATFAAAALASIASAQPTPAAPPSKFKNLQVLPAATSQDQLRATMKGFTQSLGVKCSFCHAAADARPAAGIDFPADTNPNKNIARAMMRMTHRLNAEDLPAINGLKDARVTCFTCHRGAKEPLTAVPETPPSSG